MKSKLKIWTGIGTYVVANAGAVTLLVGAAQAAPTAATGTCQAVAVSGGGEGGEAEVAPAGGEGGEGGEGGGEGGEGSTEPAPASISRFNPTVTFDDPQILSDFADSVILPTYQQLAQQTRELSESVSQFVQSPSQVTLQATRKSWLAARSPWEQSEAFAFGPAASLGYDADLDDWPINEVDIQAVLDSQTPLTADYVANLQTGQKGFHTIAFLLFGSNNDKQLSDFTPRELAYLQAVSIAFDQTANNLLTSWTEGVEGNPPYRSEFVEAGGSSNAYLTQNAAAEELIQGIMGLLDELANAKMGEPLEAQNPFLLEARFSQSSLEDFKANLRSIEITYLGQRAGSAAGERGLSKFVASVDPVLDQSVRQQIQSAQSAVAAIPGPIETTLCDPAAQPKIEAAMGSILSLFETFEQQVLPLVQE